MMNDKEFEMNQVKFVQMMIKDFEIDIDPWISKSSKSFEMVCSYWSVKTQLMIVFYLASIFNVFKQNK